MKYIDQEHDPMVDGLIGSLRQLLADVTAFVYRTQAAHWNVTGSDFHQYHEFFGVIYEEVEESVDPIAENLRKLKAPAPSSIGEQIRKTEIDSMPVDSSPRSLVKAVYRANNQVLDSLNTSFDLATKCNKQGVVDFLGSRIDMHEKWGWQLRATLDGFEDYAYPEKAEREAKKSEKHMVKVLPLFAAAEGACPPATLDIGVNLENRKNAIDTAMYGPLNPAEPNDEYWEEIASEWNVDADTARQQTCANCAMFNVTSQMKDCISEGVGPDRFDLVDATGELGYCEAFDFKCASARTCRAWVGGGPISDESEPVTAAAGDPCWEGYVQIGMKEKDGKQVPNCVPAGSAAAMEFAKKSGASTPAPKKDKISGSKKNKKGSASGEGKITFSKSVEASLKSKMEEHNKKSKSGRKATMSMLKAVYRRGAGAYSTSHRPGMTRGGWAMARVNAYLRLLSSGSPKNSSYTQDNDLLPASHPKSTRKSAAIEASGINYNVSALREVSEFANTEIQVVLKNETEYSSPEEAILALTECSGLGYEIEDAVRASWIRAVNEGIGSPFNRAKIFATMQYESGDSDLLPEEDSL